MDWTYIGVAISGLFFIGNAVYLFLMGVVAPPDGRDRATAMEILGSLWVLAAIWWGFVPAFGGLQAVFLTLGGFLVLFLFVRFSDIPRAQHLTASVAFGLLGFFFLTLGVGVI